MGSAWDPCAIPGSSPAEAGPPVRLHLMRGLQLSSLQLTRASRSPPVQFQLTHGSKSGLPPALFLPSWKTAVVSVPPLMLDEAPT